MTVEVPREATGSPARTAVRERVARPASGRRLTLTLLGIGVVAVVVRVWLLVLNGGGLGGLVGYDDGVYYGASTALAWGRMPYQEFVLLHPPGIAVVLLPFAFLGRVTHDAWGFELARVAWMGIGALNAVLVAWSVRRLGLVAAAVGGLFYALWTPVALTEVTTRLEPLVSLGLLVAVALLSRPRSALTTRVLVLAGLGLGLALSVKIWAIAPVLVVIGWCWVRSGRGAALRVTVGTALGATAICLPFFVHAPVAMFRMVVLDQLGRGHTSKTGFRRIASILDLWPNGAHGSAWMIWVVAALLVVLVVAAARSGRSGGRLAVALLVVQLGVLLASPSYFEYYAAFVVPALALCVAHGAAAVRDRLGERRVGAPGGRRVPATRVALVVVVLALLALVRVDAAASTGQPFAHGRVAPYVEDSRCVTADSPDALALSDTLSRDLGRDCPVMIDVTGLTYDTDKSVVANHVSRSRNPKWQRDLMRYLLSGQTVFLTRTDYDGLSPHSWMLVHQRTTLVQGRAFVLLGGPDGQS